MSGTDDIESVDAGLGDEAVKVSVDEGETGTGSPVAEEAGLNIVRDDVALDEGIILEEDHGCIYAHKVREVEKTGAVRGSEETHRQRYSLQLYGTAL